MTQPTIAQLRNLTNRAATGLTPDEQKRLREGIDHLHTERTDAWQKFATVAAQRDRLRLRMNALADRWDHALAVDKPYARALRTEISIEPPGPDATPSPATTTQPTITHTHLWDGTRDLPTWLTPSHYRWDGHQQLVIHHPDGDTRPQPGWTLVHWTDGITTAASPQVAERAYGPDGLWGRLQRAESELRQYTEGDSADAAAGSYAGRVEELERQLRRSEWYRQDAERRVRCQRERAETAEAAGLRDRGMQDLCEDLAEARHTAEYRARLVRHNRESRDVAEQRVARLADLHARWLAAGPPPLGQSINRWWDRRLAELGAALTD